VTEILLRVCTFKGLQNLPLYVATRQGYFAARGLRVEIAYTTGSRPQIAGLARGDYDLVQTAPDNVVHAHTDPAAFGLDPATAPHIVMLLGGSTGPLGLYAHPTAFGGAVAALDGLRGATLGVDNPTSGFALVVRDMLARHGLILDVDYRFTGAGGTAERLDALRAGAVAATLLYAPFDLMADDAGLRRLATSTDYYAAYASLTTAGLGPWVGTHADAVRDHSAAVRQALCWIHDPVNAAAAQGILQDEPTLGLDATVAARAYAAFVDAATGFGVDAALSEAGLQQVVALRAAYAPPRGTDAARDDQGLGE
jgi:ABC-type nitrate/sulfonate/bicarbonate transport system substrate-binding protein